MADPQRDTDSNPYDATAMGRRLAVVFLGLAAVFSTFSALQSPNKSAGGFIFAAVLIAATILAAWWVFIRKPAE